MYYIEEKINTIVNTLKDLIETNIEKIDGFQYIETGYKKGNTPPALSETWRKVKENKRFGGRDNHFWFHKKFKTPKEIAGKEIVFELITGKEIPVTGEGLGPSINPQSLVYLNGKIVQAFDLFHTEVLLNFDTEYDMYIYFYIGMIDDFVDFKPFLKLIDKKIESIYYDMSVPLDACRCLKKTNDNYINILKHLNTAESFLDLREPYSKEFYAGIYKARNYLYNEFYNGICGKSDVTVSCIGHTHIDVAWLWTVAQTVEKTQRSFSTVINLMRQYPEYKFMSSQPQLYKFVKQEAPELFEEIKQKVKEGRWEAEGAMLLEADCNLCSGESFIRQIIFGKRFLKDEFNIDSKILWLPDVFGYSAALPQILKKCGVDKFVTSKISWNETNKVPYDAFYWEGLDGTEIFTYFITSQDINSFGEVPDQTNYNGYIRPSQVLGTWERFQQKPYNNEAFIPFGFGDGGGGPSKDMLEQQRRTKYGLPGFPKTRIDTVGNFLNRLEDNFNKNSKVLKRRPKWVGELYLELHRGTYTSIAKNKRNNRKSELMYQTLEALAVANNVLTSTLYPQVKINKMWELILLNQFHDIIPGSSIPEVYENSDNEYKIVMETGEELIGNSIDDITANINTEGGLFVYNPHSYICSDVVDYNGKKVFAENIPSFGWKVVKPEISKNNVSVTNCKIENKYFAIILNNEADIISLVDKGFNRELVKKGEVINQLQAFEDYPFAHDAWEISCYYREKMWTVGDVVSIEQVDEGARAGLKITKRFLNSTITQKIFVYEDIDRIDFDTTIDWHEEHILLKTAFPLDIHTNEATYDIQFGNLKRPTHENTSWDSAKFEVCAHKWADISEENYGVSLINDCKYGYSIKGNVMSLTLLKCATYPNPYADKGEHIFTYSLYPHGDSLSSTVKTAYNVNVPMFCKILPARKGTLPDEYSMISCDNDDIIIETVKKAEDSDDMIIRLYNSFNKRTEAVLLFGFSYEKAYICDMLENNTGEIGFNDNKLSIKLSNYEILTVKLCNCTK